MLILTLAGNLGRDAEHKTTQNGTELCTFSVGVSTGYGENKATTWVDVTKWGKGAEGLARILRKGSKVAVSGEMSTREHNGKTYIQCRADHVIVQGTPQGGERREPDGSQGHAGGFGGDDDLDDSIPFLSMNSVW
ncbi:MAG: single-stranded DNA-binding protein [Novosphingobium sp.]|nr:single-stranded DNA-binding protein [Novosphingobium sp.]